MLKNKKAKIIFIVISIIFAILLGIFSTAVYMQNHNHFKIADKIYDFVLFCPNAKKMQNECRYHLAEDYLQRKEYVNAMLIYEKLSEREYADSFSKLQFCQYNIANALYNYENYELAQTYYAKLGDYNNASEMYYYCQYKMAEQALLQNDFEKAFSMYNALIDEAPYSHIVKECEDAFYNIALSHMHKLDWETAKTILTNLPNHAKSVAAIKSCDYWCEATSSDELIDIEANNVILQTELGTLYELYNSYIYIPKELNEATKALIYFSGGMGGNILDKYYPQNYVKNYNPNAFCIFMRGSGCTYMEKQFSNVLNILSSLINNYQHCPTEISIIGSSNGGYSALRFAAYLYSTVGMDMLSISILDMGLNWEDLGFRGNLNDDEIECLAQSETTVYAFEQSSYLDCFSPVVKMREGNIEVIGVECTNKGHDAITKIAFANGMFSWTLQETELDSNEYSF